MSRSLSRKDRGLLARLVLFPLILTSFPESGDAQAVFSDLGNHKKDRPAITSMVEQGVMRSASQARFNPAGINGRGDFAASIQQMFNLPVPAQKLDFPDVPTSSPNYMAVQAIAPYLGRQIRCPGCALTSTLGPNEPVSRLEAAIVLTNILIAQKKVVFVSPEAADKMLAGRAEEMRGPLGVYVATAIQNGILQTVTDAREAGVKFNRANLATLLDNVQKKFSIPQATRRMQ